MNIYQAQNANMNIYNMMSDNEQECQIPNEIA